MKDIKKERERGRQNKRREKDSEEKEMHRAQREESGKR